MPKLKGMAIIELHPAGIPRGSVRSDHSDFLRETGNVDFYVKVFDFFQSVHLIPKCILDKNKNERHQCPAFKQ